MVRSLVICLALMGVLFSHVAPAQADWDSFWSRFKLDRKRMACWPEPFNEADRKLTVAPFERMVVKGWQRQTTLGHSHFNPETQSLTEAGELKVRWILTQAPSQHRQVWVLRGLRPEDSEARIDSVQQYAARALPDQPLPNVLATDVEPAEWPADYVDAIDRQLDASIPAPRLPNPTGISTSN
ncbi:MAG: hypothetical protein O2931_03050 [Planctomycetota bacterium]|nr:hypothetical protein [Planctomycetota bacterium]MDA1177755.1 hypothetical protein [Planctomycetota bacterium]